MHAWTVILFYSASYAHLAVPRRLRPELLAGASDQKNPQACNHRRPRAGPSPDGRRPPPLGRGSASPPLELDRGPRLPGGVHPPLRRAGPVGGGDDGGGVRRGVSQVRGEDGADSGTVSQIIVPP